MVKGLESYAAPHKTGGEQDYISEHLGLKEELTPLDAGYNFQIHQISLTMVNDAEEGRELEGGGVDGYGVVRKSRMTQAEAVPRF